jgi:predicted O-methyltransferase YrrM
MVVDLTELQERQRQIYPLARSLSEVVARGAGLDYALTIYLLCLACRPKVVYEIGVGEGISTLMFLTALRTTNGLLYSCDIEDCSEAVSSLRLNWKSRWKFFHMDSLEFLACMEGGADLIYIDGDHHADRVRLELTMAWDLLSDGGWAVLHDIVYLPGPGGPREVFEQWRTRKDVSMSLEIPWAYGFGILQKEGGREWELYIPF